MRLYDEKRRALLVGDKIRFTNVDTQESCLAEVTFLERYDTFAELYVAFDQTEIGYAPGEKADPKDMLEYYSEEQIARYGVLAIGIRVIG